MLLPGTEGTFKPKVASDGAAGDEWYTQQWLLNWLGPIALDPCYSPASLVKAAAVIDLRQGGDGTTDPWEPVGDGIVFCNPPFSDTATWLYLCRTWAQRLQRVVVALVPAVPGDGPWHDEVHGYAPLVGDLRGRIPFRNPKGRVETKGRGHSLVLYGQEADARALARQISERAKGSPHVPVWRAVVVP